MSEKKKARKGARAKSGTLMMIAILLMGSAIVRLGIDAGPAIAREVASLQKGGSEREADSGQLHSQTMPSSAELQEMLAAFKEREAALAAREAEIEDRMKALEIADEAIEKKLAALQDAEEKLKSTLALADGATESDVARLTTVYEQMKPKESAALFEEMDPTFAAGFLARMRPEAAAGIMAGLSPEAAYTISVVLAGRNGAVPKE
ncbi:MotE family protein [Phycobacter sedimenti]|jgi:flagellar motility protein MotE (MotC chaperone)|uniref:MotE family protein n=1 Tax=Phycobacter sedimenti TaxID=3133977 RepID=UPI00311F44C0